MSFRKSLVYVTLIGALLIDAFASPAMGGENSSTAVFNVRDFGAVGDSNTLDTSAIDKAIKACATAGGGTVLFPPGQYLTGTFELHSHVTLNLDAGAVILGSKDLADYRPKKDYFANAKSGNCGEGLKAGIIVANKAENIAIIGHGTIDGRGTYFVDVDKPHLGLPQDFDKASTRQGDDFLSPKLGKSNEGPVKPWMDWNDRPGPLIILADCKNVAIGDVTLKDSHNWTLTIANCDDVTIRGIAVLGNVLIPNNDGINIHARNARISDCNIQAGDDGIAANGCENLTVMNCTLVSRSSAIRFSGGKYCTFQNLVIRDSNRGIGIYGSANSVLFSNIVIQTRLFNGDWWGMSEPIHISTGPGRDSTSMPRVKDVRFSNIIADSESCILIYGTVPGLIEDLSFDQIKLRIKGGENSAAVGGNFDLRGDGVDDSIVKHDIPAMYCQYVNGLRIRGFELQWAPELPDYFTDGIHCEHVNDLVIDGFSGRQAQKSGPGAAIALAHVDNVSVQNSRAPNGTAIFLALNDASDERLFVNNDLTQAKQPTEPSKTDFQMIDNLLPRTTRVAEAR
jgi:Pectate lyase superfamily protein/Glycosyl hydrolases family 28